MVIIVFDGAHDWGDGDRMPQRGDFDTNVSSSEQKPSVPLLRSLLRNSVFKAPNARNAWMHEPVRRALVARIRSTNGTKQRPRMTQERLEFGC